MLRNPREDRKPRQSVGPEDEITLVIEKTVYGGEGMGYAREKACFVEGALAGEKVRAAVTHTRKNHLKARLLEVLEPSPHRITPACFYNDRCGGCQYQHVAYAEEVRIKEAQVREALTRGAGVEASKIAAITASPKEFGYRNSVRLHRTVVSPGPVPQRLAFIGRDNSTPICVDKCLLVDERLAGVFETRHRLPVRQDDASFKLDEKGEVISDRNELYFRVRVGGESILTSSEGFFQNNLAVTELIAKRVGEWIARFLPETFVDLYAGVGTFSLLSATSAKTVVCAEESKTSLECLRINLVEKRKGSYKILKGRVETTFAQWWKAEKLSGSSVVFLDPPRQGVAAEFAAFLAGIEGPAALVYLSCDLATLARDLKAIASQGKWHVREVAPFDMFPRTRHVETLVLLEPASA